MKQIAIIRKKLKEKIKEGTTRADIAHELRMTNGGLSLFLNGKTGLSGESVIYALSYLDDKFKRHLEEL